MSDLRNRSRALWTIAALIAVVGVVAVLWLVTNVLRPLPPHRVVMATGSEGSDYAELASRYRDILARSDITLDLVPTAGAIENLAILQAPQQGVDAGFLQGGITNEAASPDLVSLGTVFYEPLWLFVPESFAGQRIETLRGRRVSIGIEGSGGRALSLALLAKIGLTPAAADLLPFPPEVAAAKLLAGDVDAATMMESWDSPVVKQLLASPLVRVASFPRPDAYVGVFPFLSKLVLPAGAGDIGTGRPPEDAILLAPKASLVVRRDLHPAIQYLLLQAATQIHSGPGIFGRWDLGDVAPSLPSRSTPRSARLKRNAERERTCAVVTASSSTGLATAGPHWHGGTPSERAGKRCIRSVNRVSS